jgi:probable HAF family extracellular repeat protein
MNFDPMSAGNGQVISSLRRGFSALLVSASLLAALCAPRASGQGFQVTALTAPGSSGETLPYGINSSGEVVGAFTPKAGGTKGFVYSAGKYTVLSGPPGTDGYIRALGINSAASPVVVGDYKTSDNRFHGYFYEKGTYTNYDFNATNSSGVFAINDHGDFAGDFGEPNPEGFAVIKGVKYEFYGKPGSTYATYSTGINDSDEVVGYYFGSGGLTHGFLRSPTGGKITEIDYPGAKETQCFAINNAGEISGSYINSHGQPYGFTYAKGKYSTTDFASANGLNASGDMDGSYYGVDAAPTGYVALPQAFSLSKVAVPAPYSDYWAILNSINNAGVMVGGWNDSTGNTHGMMIENGHVTTIDNPDGVQTVLFGINAKNQIVGDAFDSQGNPHGFLYSDGKFTSIPGPAGALSSDATGINESGWIDGDFYGTDKTHHGFILKGSAYKELNIPGASSTAAAGMNNSGMVVLVGVDAKGYTESYLYTGTAYESIAVPGASENLAASINTAGDIVYRIYDQYGIGHAALKKGKDYYIFDFPGGENSGALGINDNGEIVGFYSPAGKPSETVLYKGTE